MQTRRFVVAAGGAALSGAASAARAQSQLAAGQLDRLVKRALATPGTTAFTRVEVLGFHNVEVITRQTSHQVGDVAYYLAVTEPRLKDGLIFFTSQPSVRTFRIHRTDTHLLRIASATNEINGRGVEIWDGPSADQDFSAQLAVWAAVP